MDSSQKGRSSALNRYFAEIRTYPMLTRDQERVLAEKVQRSGSTESLNELVESNLSFVVRIASEYRNLGLPLEDLVNEGNMGLITAARRFDVSKGTKFITYAIWWIRKSILKALTAHSHLVRVPTYQMKKVREIRETEESLRQTLGRTPRREEVSRELDRNLSRVDRVLQLNLREMSLDDKLGQDREKPVSEYLVDRASPDPERELIRRESGSLVWEAIRRLSPQERKVIRHRFGIPAGPVLTLKEIGEMMKVSRERVRQIEWQALQRLRRFLVGKRLVRASSRKPYSRHRSVGRMRRYP